MLPIAALRRFSTAIIFAFVLDPASPPSSMDRHHQQQALEPVQEPEAEQRPPSPPPSHGIISSIVAAEVHPHCHLPKSSQPALSFAPSQAQPNDDQLRIRHFALRVSPNTETFVHFHAVDIDPVGLPAGDGERKAKQPRPVNLGKVFLGLTYQAMVSFMVFHYSSPANITTSHHARMVSILLDLAEVTVVVGFTASLIGLVIRDIYVEKAMILEKAGSASASLGFFLLMGMFLTKVSTVTGLLGGVGSFVAFVLVFIKMKKEGNPRRY